VSLQISLTKKHKGFLMGQTKGKIGNHRWTICALLFFATTINYLDRNILGILAPTLTKEIGWTTVEYGYITTAFQAAYALGLIFFGWFIDKFGTKIGYSLSIVGWSLAAMAHALATTVFGFGTARFFLGISESGNFPAAIKATAEWFPKKERALATGIFNSGANIGAVVAPAVVPWLTVTYGWQAAFIATGATGFIWLVFWILFYEKPEAAKKLKKEEMDYILSDPPEPAGEKVPWLKLLKYRQTWAFVIGKFLTDPIWWFYLYWLGLFLNKNFGLTLTGLGLPLIVIYMMTSVGSIGGGWISGAMINRGIPVNKARKIAMLTCALLVVPVVTAANVTSLWLAVSIIGLAAAAHQGWSANIFTTASDMFPKKAVGSVVGLGSAAGSIGGMIFLTSSGYIVTATGSYMVLFIICGSAYLIALGLMTLLTANAKPIDL
jgi:ACS family hexuronate transporter-like MFS transporter